MISGALKQAYIDKVRRGEEPTVDEALAFLRDWHARHPGATGRVLAPFRLGNGQSTYEWLATCVPEKADVAVMDLCCGDGVLLEQVMRRLGPGGSAVGVDASEEDLEGARARVTDPRACFHTGLADALPIPAASVDVVLCHYALMLLRPLEAVAREIARVLRPGGLFAAVVPAQWNLATVAPELGTLMQEIRTSDLPAFPRIGLGDPMFARQGAGAFFHAESGFSPQVSMEALPLQMRSAPDEILHYIELTYPFDLFLPEHQQRIREEGKRILIRAAEPDGRLSLSQEIQLVRVRKAE